MSTLPIAPEETLRPQFHFTAPWGWLNDPNGLVYYRGEYHLFYQHNPFGTEWGNMTWGHAVSKDLLHWSHLPNALEPDKTGTMYSGSAVVDRDNTSGFGTKGTAPLVMFYTAAGGKNDASKGVPFSQGMAYSTDGRTFAKFSGNPVVSFIEAENRDPKVIWHQPSKNWIMALYLDGDRYVLFRSPDLKKWTKSGDVTMPRATGECPDIFELAVDGKAQDKRWVFWSANGAYRLGKFDGFKFTPDTEPIESVFGANDYAAQTYSDEPKNRRVQISWMRGGSYPGMPFNQQMTLPRELTLRSTPEGPRLSTLPISEMSGLRNKKLFDKSNIEAPARVDVPSDLVEIRAVIRRDCSATIKLGERSIHYDAAAQTVSCMGRSAKLKSASGDVDIIVYLDRTTIEIFADNGFLSMPFCFVPNARISLVEATSDGAPAFKKLQIYELKSALSDPTP